MTALRALLPFARRSAAQRQTHARCELCSAAVAERHAHVVELAAHQLRCACMACAVLFRDENAGAGRFRTVPDRVLSVSARGDDAEWAKLGVPVQLAFLLRRARWMALYPSPAGPVEAELSDGAIEVLQALVPRAQEVEREVEALLLHRPRGAAPRAFIVPIDACFELTGLVRRRWRGFDGGDEARAAIDAFIARLDGAAKKEAR